MAYYIITVLLVLVVILSLVIVSLYNALKNREAWGKKMQMAYIREHAVMFNFYTVLNDMAQDEMGDRGYYFSKEVFREVYKLPSPPPEVK
jgi:competence protein ComGC